MRPGNNAPLLMLNSWKEIALFLDRGVRTVQRWERDFQLPVHRLGKGKRSPVYAVASELKFWIRTTGAPQIQRRQSLLNQRFAVQHASAASVREESHQFLAEFHRLVQIVAENTMRQRRQTELLEKRLLALRSRLGR